MTFNASAFRMWLISQIGSGTDSPIALLASDAGKDPNFPRGMITAEQFADHVFAGYAERSLTCHLSEMARIVALATADTYARLTR